MEQYITIKIVMETMEATWGKGVFDLIRVKKKSDIALQVLLHIQNTWTKIRKEYIKMIKVVPAVG